MEPEHEQDPDDQRRMMIAVALSVVVYWFFMTFVIEPPPPPPEQAVEPSAAESVAEASASTAASSTPVPSPIATPEVSTEAPARSVPVANDAFNGTWSSFGGGPSDIALTKYGAADTTAPWIPTWILDGVLSGFDFEPFRLARPELGPHHLLEDTEGVSLPVALTADDGFAADRRHYEVLDGTATAFRTVRDGIEITKRYTPGSGYVFDYTVELRNVGSAVKTMSPAFGVADHVSEVEGYYTPKRMPYASVDGDIEDKDAEDILEDGSKSWEGIVDWVAIHDKYFMLGLEPTEPIAGRAVALADGGERRVAAALAVPEFSLAPGEARSYSFKLFTGPMVLSDMREAGLRSAEAVDFGFFGIIAIPILIFLKFLYGIIGSWGLSIIVLTVVIKAALFPLSQKSYKSMKAMQKLAPEIEKLKEKHGEDREALNRDMMALWKEHGVNPAGGCLPMLLQMPIWFALYRVLWNSVELYQTEFLYFADLTMRDPLALFPILLGVTMYAQQKFTTTSATMDPVQKKMMQFMPLFFSLIMFTLPAGLVVYILVNNILSIAQQWVIHRSNDDAPTRGSSSDKAVAAGRSA